MRTFLHVLYWIAVLAVSLALVVGLILALEARDASDVGSTGPSVEGTRLERVAPPPSRG